MSFDAFFTEVVEKKNRFIVSRAWYCSFLTSQMAQHTVFQHELDRFLYEQKRNKKMARDAWITLINSTHQNELDRFTILAQ
jgi:hypothetical protein